MSNPYAEGYAANGNRRVKNPYEPNSVDHALWEEGFRDGLEAVRDSLARHWW